MGGWIGWGMANESVGQALLAPPHPPQGDFMGIAYPHPPAGAPAPGAYLEERIFAAVKARVGVDVTVVVPLSIVLSVGAGRLVVVNRSKGIALGLGQPVLVAVHVVIEREAEVIGAVVLDESGIRIVRWWVVDGGWWTVGGGWWVVGVVDDGWWVVDGGWWSTTVSPRGL